MYCLHKKRCIFTVKEAGMVKKYVGEEYTQMFHDDVIFIQVDDNK